MDSTSSSNIKYSRVEDADDPRIAEFCHIKERDLVRNKDQFIAEGKTVLQHLINASQVDKRFGIEKILVLRNRFAGLSNLLMELDADIEVFVAEQEVMDAIAGFHMHRGVLALGTYLADDELPDLSDAKLVLVLSAISNHDNLGSIFRNAAAFGVDLIFLDKQCCHPLYRKAIRVSVGATLTKVFHFGLDMPQILDLLTAKGFDIYGLTPNEGEELNSLDIGSRNALMLGAEGEGLDDSFLAQTKSVRIAQTSELDSLNVATASGIALYRFSQGLG